MFCPAGRKSSKSSKIRADLKRRRGMGIIEAIIAIIVLSITVFAIISTLATSLALQNTARANINARIFASSWFEAFESINPEPIDSTYSNMAACDTVADFLDPNCTKLARSETDLNYIIQGYSINIKPVSVGTAYREVTLTLTLPAATGGDKDFTVMRRINARSGETVSDDRYEA